MAWEYSSVAESGRRRTPVLVISANAMSEHVAAAYDAGADRHIAKPVTPNHLLEMLGIMIDAAADSDQGALQARA